MFLSGIPICHILPADSDHIDTDRLENAPILKLQLYHQRFGY
jgi:hypothetical protein